MGLCPGITYPNRPSRSTGGAAGFIASGVFGNR
jgi:hypothetical protein